MVRKRLLARGAVFIRMPLLLAGVSILGNSASGQRQEPPTIEFTGTVGQVAPGHIEATSPSNETWILHIPPGANVQVTGAAQPDMLRPGHFVRLTATVDKRGRAHDKVNHLTLIEPADRPGRRLGAFPPGQDEAGEQDVRGMAGMPAGGGDRALFDIRGRITNYRQGYLALEVPAPLFQRPLRLEVDDSLTVGLDVSDHRLAQPGDAITAKGGQIGPKVMLANEVSIVLSEPVAEAKKKPPAPGQPRLGRPDPRKGQQEERDPFDLGQPNAQEPSDVGANGPDAPPEGVARPREPIEPPRAAHTAAEPANADSLAAFLAPLPEDPVRLNIRVRLGDAPPVIFIPCKPVVGNDLIRQFGRPDNTLDLRGELPVGRNRSRQEVRWELWVYGSTKLFVDETGMVRFRQAR